MVKVNYVILSLIVALVFSFVITFASYNYQAKNISLSPGDIQGKNNAIGVYSLFFAILFIAVFFGIIIILVYLGKKDKTTGYVKLNKKFSYNA